MHQEDTRPLWSRVMLKNFFAYMTRVFHQTGLIIIYRLFFFFPLTTLIMAWLKWVFCVKSEPPVHFVKKLWKSNLGLGRLNINNSCSTQPTLSSRYINRHLLIPHSRGCETCRPARPSVVESRRSAGICVAAVNLHCRRVLFWEVRS